MRNEFDIKRFYADAFAGNPIDTAAVFDYINSFDTVIIWGAGNLGSALEEKLRESGVKVTAFWDQAYSVIGAKNGLPVLESFGENPAHNKATTLLVCGIVNGTMSHKWQEAQARIHGYGNFILGMQLYAGTVCGFRRDLPIDVSVCAKSKICNFNTCKKYVNIFSRPSEGKEYRLACNIVNLLVGYECTLCCESCGQHLGLMRESRPDNYRLYPLEQIKKDLDAAMEVIDHIGGLSIIGGEPFANPKLNEVVGHALSKPNIAVVSVTTNGIYRVADDYIKSMKHDRLKVNFSNYTAALGERQKALFADNVAQMKRCGIDPNISVPIWSDVEGFDRINPDVPEKYYVSAKEACIEDITVANGKIYACPQTGVYEALGIPGIEEDIISLCDTPDLKRVVYEMRRRPYYPSCRFLCGNQEPHAQVQPGIQRRGFNTPRSANNEGEASAL
jgi:hypothetical protein